MGQKHKRFLEVWTPFLLRVISKNPRSNYARVSKVMAQFVLKIGKLSHIMGPTPILEMARAYGLRPRLWLLIQTHISTTVVTTVTSTVTTVHRTNQYILRLGNLCWNNLTERFVKHSTDEGPSIFYEGGGADGIWEIPCKKPHEPSSAYQFF